MIQLSSIFHLVLKSKSINVDQISIRSLSEPANPFSFWQWIFRLSARTERRWKTRNPDARTDPRPPMAFHRCHYQWNSKYHLLDESFCMANENRDQTQSRIPSDHKVMESGTNKKAYQYHLLGLANQNRQTGLYNNFNLSHLKTELKWWTKKEPAPQGISNMPCLHRWLLLYSWSATLKPWHGQPKG